MLQSVSTNNKPSSGLGIFDFLQPAYENIRSLTIYSMPKLSYISDTLSRLKVERLPRFSLYDYVNSHGSLKEHGIKSSSPTNQRHSLLANILRARLGIIIYTGSRKHLIGVSGSGKGRTKSTQVNRLISHDKIFHPPLF